MPGEAKTIGIFRNLSSKTPNHLGKDGGAVKVIFSRREPNVGAGFKPALYNVVLYSCYASKFSSRMTDRLWSQRGRARKSRRSAHLWEAQPYRRWRRRR